MYGNPKATEALQCNSTSSPPFTVGTALNMVQTVLHDVSEMANALDERLGPVLSPAEQPCGTEPGGAPVANCLVQIQILEQYHFACSIRERLRSTLHRIGL